MRVKPGRNATDSQHNMALSAKSGPNATGDHHVLTPQRSDDDELNHPVTRAWREVFPEPSRNHLVSTLRRVLAAGLYHPRADQVAETMIRQAIQDGQRMDRSRLEIKRPDQ